MKVSEWLREYQLTGQVPETTEPNLALWAGWMMGHRGLIETDLSGRIELAIRAAEFIEEHAR